MNLCYDCQNAPEHADLKRWHFRTLDTPCDQCDKGYSHERVHSRGGDGRK